jgi:hypothetical protein
VIATMRSKTEWTTVDNNGRKTPQRVGLAPEQGKGVEYEFDLLVEISTEHVANVIKDRTGRFQDKLLDKPGEQFGKDLAAWLAEGTAPPKADQRPSPKVVAAKAVAAEPAEEPAEEPLRDRIAAYIATAATVPLLVTIGNRLDELFWAEEITYDEHEELTARLNARHQEIEPVTEAAS